MKIAIALIVLIANITWAGDTVHVYIKSINHTDTAYTTSSYKLVNYYSDTVIVDSVHFHEGNLQNYIGIGPKQFDQYPVYYTVINGIKEYCLVGSSLFLYRKFNQIQRSLIFVDIIKK